MGVELGAPETLECRQEDMTVGPDQPLGCEGQVERDYRALIVLTDVRVMRLINRGSRKGA